MKKGYRQQLPDRDPQETEEWIDSIDSIIEIKGEERARYLLQTLIREARDRNIAIPLMTNSPYVNTIPPESEPEYPGNEIIEKKIRRIIRWNAAMMVSKANKNLNCNKYFVSIRCCCLLNQIQMVRGHKKLFYHQH